MSHHHGQDETPGIRGEQEGRNGYSDSFCNRLSGQESASFRGKQKRITRKTCEGESPTPGGEIAGGTLSQLIEDCKEQIAGNEQIISTLQDMNESLGERINYYQRLIEQIQKHQE